MLFPQVKLHASCGSISHHSVTCGVFHASLAAMVNGKYSPIRNITAVIPLHVKIIETPHNAGKNFIGSHRSIAGFIAELPYRTAVTLCKQDCSLAFKCFRSIHKQNLSPKGNFRHCRQAVSCICTALPLSITQYIILKLCCLYRTVGTLLIGQLFFHRQLLKNESFVLKEERSHNVSEFLLQYIRKFFYIIPRIILSPKGAVGFGERFGVSH